MKPYVTVLCFLLILTTLACGSAALREPRGVGTAGTVREVYELSATDVLRDTADWEWYSLDNMWKTDNFEVMCDAEIFRYTYQEAEYPVSADRVVVAVTDEFTMFFYVNSAGKLTMQTEVNSSE